MRITTYIPAGLRDDFDLAVNWVYDHKLIKKESRWMFCQMAIRNTILYIMEQIKEENIKKAQSASTKATRTILEPQQQTRDTQETPKIA